MNDHIELKSEAKFQDWKALVLKYQEASITRAMWQLINTVGGYVLLWVLMYWTLKVSWWFTFPLAILAGGLVIRIFIIFHDCGHGSFFKSKAANDIVGFVAGILTFTPYYHWRWEHSLHHGTSSNLDRRGTGDIWTMTVQEYLESSRWKRFAYRLARNPVVLFVIAPVFLFVVRERFPSANASPKERRSVYWMNAAILGMVVGMSIEDAYWERGDEWDYTTAALQGSSFYKLPKVLQWFSGNIGFHHIHHLSPRIPNYNLERCHNSHPLFQSVKPVTLFGSMKSMAFRLWDERGRKLVSFRHLRDLRHR
jgi:acyl-lipid omega-6 desaturase (Delta-12 desaturase)